MIFIFLLLIGITLSSLIKNHDINKIYVTQNGYAMIFSLIANLFAFSIGLFIIRLYTPLYFSVFLAVFLSFTGHLAGASLYSLMHTDSADQYFALASPVFQGTGTPLIKNIVWYVRYIFTGDSLLATFYFFSPFAFLGSILWYVLYLRLSAGLRPTSEPRQWQPFLIMCWPSFLFFTAGIVKDSMIFFVIPLFFLALYNISQRSSILFNVFKIGIIAAIMALLRPYLVMITLTGILFYGSAFKAQKQLGHILLKTAAILLIMVVVVWVLNTQGNMETIDTTSIANKITFQQSDQARGTHFVIPSDNPIVRLFLLPYSFMMNLLFPLFYLAGNAVGVIASFENILLVFICYQLIKNRDMIKQIFNEIPLTRSMFYFFVFGMFFMASVNTNLGLSTRQKSMYVPCILVLYCILLDRKKPRKL